MTYSATIFRKNMWEILDNIRYERKVEYIWRRNKKEFVIIPFALWQEYNFDNEIDNWIIDSMDNLEKKWTLDDFNDIILKKEKEWKL